MILDQSPRAAFTDFVSVLRDEAGEGADRIAALAQASVAFLRGRPEVRAARRDLRVLETRWYGSLAAGAPDYSVYSSPLYLAELWACWVVYSRYYLRGLRRTTSLPPAGVLARLGPVKSVADLGCGIGLSTAALRQVFPGARVVGTDLPETPQAQVARRYATRYGFTVASEVTERADLIFASEYFEHFPAPVDHLRAVLAVTRPRALLVANTFTAPSIGHFNLYEVDRRRLDGAATTRAFGAELRRSGYRPVKTSLWNNRPALWEAE